MMMAERRTTDRLLDPAIRQSKSVQHEPSDTFRRMVRLSEPDTSRAKGGATSSPTTTTYVFAHNNADVANFVSPPTICYQVDSSFGSRSRNNHKSFRHTKLTKKSSTPAQNVGRFVQKKLLNNGFLTSNRVDHFGGNTPATGTGATDWENLPERKPDIWEKFRPAHSIMNITRNWRLPLIGAIRTESVLLLMTLLAVVFGTLFGILLNPIVRERELDPLYLVYLKFPGDLFMRMLKMIIVPLVISSNVSAIASLNARAARTLTLMSVLYYISTTLIAVMLGVFLAMTIQPGIPRHYNTTWIQPKSPKLINASVNVMESILDLARNMVPENLFRATFQKSNFVRAYRNETVFNAAENTTERLYGYKETLTEGTNILGLITFSILFGFAVHNLGTDAAILADLFHATRRAIIYLVSIVIWFSPIGILCLIAAELASTKELGRSLQTLSLYVATVMTSLLIHGCVILPALLFFLTGRNPLRYARNMLQALMCALGTASSTATLPCTIRCLESGNQIDVRVTRFMLPLGTTINMDGTATFQAIAVCFIAQMTGHELTIHDLILIVFTSMLASMAATSMPSAGMITIIMVLTAVDLPSSELSILLPVVSRRVKDWFLDRFRTMVNVFSNSVGAAIVSQMCHSKLMETPADCASVPEAATDQDMVQYVGGLTECDMELPPEMTTQLRPGSRSWYQAQQNGRLTNRLTSPLRSPTSDSISKRRNTLPALNDPSDRNPATTAQMLTVAGSDATTLNEEMLDVPHYQTPFDAGSPEPDIERDAADGRHGNNYNNNGNGSGGRRLIPIRGRYTRMGRPTSRNARHLAPMICMIDDETVFVEL